jgi:hypothetical protein
MLASEKPAGDFVCTERGALGDVASLGHARKIAVFPANGADFSVRIRQKQPGRPLPDVEPQPMGYTLPRLALDLD